MTNTTNITKEQRATMLAILKEAHPDLKLGRTSNAKLVEMIQALQDDHKLSMSEILSQYRKNYVTSVTPTGRKSKSNGDQVALALEGFEALQVIIAAEQLLGLKKGELQEKYFGMPAGQARMNAGNRIRGAFRREDVTIEEIEQAVAKA